MASNAYNYPPPPPPPQPQQASQPAAVGYQQYQQPQYGQAAASAAMGPHRGRGGYNAMMPYSPHQTAYTGAQAPTGYGQTPPAYIGPQAPTAAGYPTANMWRGNPQQVQQPPQHQLASHNYHPNYAPQPYGPVQPQYGAQQPQAQSYAPQGQYPQATHMAQGQHQAGQPQWQAPQQHHPNAYNGGGRGRGRGGRVDAPLMGPPIRMGFDSTRSSDPLSQASNGYPQYGAPPHGGQQSPPVPFSAPTFAPQGQFQSYPPNNQSHRGGRPSFDHGHFNQGGRGRGGSSRGRGGRNDRGGFRNNKPNHHNRGGDFSSIDTQKPGADAKSGEKKKKKKKRKTNTLGLTPGADEHQESEEEDDADEEAKLAASGLDYNGPVPEMPADLAAWIEERKKKWPTKARREEKEAELAKQRQARAEQSAKDRAKSKEALGSSVDRKLEKQRLKAEKLRKQLERAEQKVQEAQAKAGMKRKRNANDIGDEGDTTMVEGDAVDQVIANATAGASLSDSDSSSSTEFTSATDSEDEAPQRISSKRAAPAQVLPPKKNILQRHCKYYSTGGTCGKKGKCRFIHDDAVRAAAIREKEANGGRMTLAQRLIQNDKEKDDLMVLKSIKFLMENGVLDEPADSKVGASAMDVDTAEATEENTAQPQQ